MKLSVTLKQSNNFILFYFILFFLNRISNKDVTSCSLLFILPCQWDFEYSNYTLYKKVKPFPTKKKKKKKKKKSVLGMTLSSNCGGAHDVMVIVVGNGHDKTSSNPGRDWLHFT